MLSRETWYKSSFSDNGANACVEALAVEPDVDWRISSASGDGNSCVEMKPFDGAVHIRNSNHPDRGITAIDADAWRAFIEDVKAEGFEV